MSFLDDARTGELWAKVKAALSDKQSKLTGQPGQVVGFGADGAAQAVRGWSNPNLLDNGYFLAPVNQKEQTVYDTEGYTIDLWRVVPRDYGTSLTVDETGVTFEVTSKGADNRGAFIYQRKASLKAGTYTFSVLVSQANGSAFMGVDRDEAPFGHLSKEIPLKVGLNTVTFTIANDEGVVGIFLAKRVTDIVSFKFVAAKLEQASQQTLAHQDASGNWVLNDPPPDKTIELLKCQRYFYRLKNSRYRMVVFSNGNNSARFEIDLPVTMAKTPALSFHANNDDVQWIRNITNNGIYKLSEINQKYVGEFSGKNIVLALVLPAPVTDAQLYVDGYIDFDANL